MEKRAPIGDRRWENGMDNEVEWRKEGRRMSEAYRSLVDYAFFGLLMMYMATRTTPRTMSGLLMSPMLEGPWAP